MMRGSDCYALGKLDPSHSYFSMLFGPACLHVEMVYMHQIAVLGTKLFEPNAQRLCNYIPLPEHRHSR